MKAGRIICNLVLLISFFLPWVDVMISTVSGFQIPGMIKDFSGGGGAGMANLLYLIPILSIITLIIQFMNKRTKGIGMVTGIVPLLILIYMIIKGGSLLQGNLTFGIYLTGLAAIGVLVTSFLEPARQLNHQSKSEKTM